MSSASLRMRDAHTHSHTDIYVCMYVCIKIYFYCPRPNVYTYTLKNALANYALNGAGAITFKILVEIAKIKKFMNLCTPGNVHIKFQRNRTIFDIVALFFSRRVQSVNWAKFSLNFPTQNGNLKKYPLRKPMVHYFSHILEASTKKMSRVT